MSPASPESQLVLLDLVEDQFPELSAWAEWLSDYGFHVQLASWGLDDDCVPDVIVHSDVVSENLKTRFADPLESKLISTISIDSDQESTGAEYYLARDADRVHFSQTVAMAAEIVQLLRRLNVDQLKIQSLSSLALTDPLTGIANRRAWSDEITDRLNEKEAICIAIIDADFFKTINDNDGHNVGDSVLRAMADAMRTKLRGRDFLARLGGDEFGLLISDVNHAVADSIVERIRASVTDRLSTLDLPNVTLSAGYVFVEKYSGVSEELLYSMASKALSVAKRQQRNCTYGHLV